MAIEGVNSSGQSLAFSNFADQAELALSGDPEAALALLVLRSAHDDRDLTKAERDLAETQQRQLEQEQVEHLRDQADHVLEAGLLRGFGQMASGALSFTGSALAVGEPQQEAERLMAELNGAGKALEGATQFGAAFADSAAKNAEADALTAQQSAQHIGNRIDELSGLAKESADAQRSALDSASELVRTSAATDNAAIFLRG